MRLDLRLYLYPTVAVALPTGDLSGVLCLRPVSLAAGSFVAFSALSLSVVQALLLCSLSSRPIRCRSLFLYLGWRILLFLYHHVDN